jgi:hypothetical protein
MTHPKNVRDLALAPVAAEIDHNLQRLRGKSGDEIRYELELELDEPAKVDSRDARAELVLALAVRGVDLRGWSTAITEDGSAVRLSGGSVSLDVALGTTVTAFVGQLAVA